MKIGGRIPWNVIAICETFKISGRMERHHMRLGEPFQGPVIPFGAMVVSAEDLSRLHQLRSKVLPGALHAGRIWKRDILVADIEELEEMDASEIHAQRLNAKEMLTPMNV